MNDSSLKELNKALGQVVKSVSITDFQELEGDGVSEFENLTNPPPEVLVNHTATTAIINDYERKKDSEKDLTTSIKNNYVKEITLRDRIENLIELSKKYSDLKFLINTIHATHRPGKFINNLFSIGIVQMTLTSIWCNPLLATGFFAYLGYVYMHDSKVKEYRDTKIALGIGTLIFNNISPFIFDPAHNPFLFMTYLYFSMSAWGVLTSSLEKTKLLSKITYITGANAFVIESPFVYLGTLTLLEKGYLDDVIQKTIGDKILPNIIAGNLLPSIKATAKAAVSEYLVNVTDILRDSFKTTIELPYVLIKDFIEGRKINKEFVDIPKTSTPHK